MMPVLQKVEEGMRILRRTLVVMVPLLLAQATPAAAGSGRFTMTPTDKGVVRLDTETGAMALCMHKAGRWSCEDMDDSQGLLLKEIETLKADNRLLKDQVEQLEETLGIGENQAAAPEPGTKFALPSEQDVDKAFDYLDGMLKKLRERMEKLEKEHGRDGGRAL